MEKINHSRPFYFIYSCSLVFSCQPKSGTSRNSKSLKKSNRIFYCAVLWQPTFKAEYAALIVNQAYNIGERRIEWILRRKIRRTEKPLAVVRTLMNTVFG